jgi:hypothetical protein
LIITGEVAFRAGNGSIARQSTARLGGARI